MRRYNMASYPLIGVTAAAMLMVQLSPQAAAQAEKAPEAATVAPAAAPAPAPSEAASEAAGAKPAGETAATQAGASAEAAAVKPKPLPPSLVARINLTSQTMTVSAGGKAIHSWKVSSGAPGYATPPGTFKPGWMAKMWYSRQYDDAPMPHSVFFNGGIAVHATTSTGMLGRPASHGCVRLAPANAARFYQLVSKHGMGMTRIVVHGAQPFGRNADRIARSNNRSNRNGNARTASRGGNSVQDSYRYVAQTPRNSAPRYTVARSPAPYWTRY